MSINKIRCLHSLRRRNAPVGPESFNAITGDFILNASCQNGHQRQDTHRILYSKSKLEIKKKRRVRKKMATDLKILRPLHK